MNESAADIGFGVSIVNRYSRNRVLHMKDTMMGVLSSVKHMKPSASLLYRKNAHKVVREAYDAGIRVFDTARIYGYSEYELGLGLKGIPREDVFICTKVSDMDLTRPGGAATVEGNLRNSLKDLGTDYVDLYLLHWPCGAWIEMYAEMVEMQRKGLARHIGVCNFTLENFVDLGKHPELPMPEYCQIESHPFFRNQEVFNYCRERGIIVMAHTPTARMCPEFRENSVLAQIARNHQVHSPEVALRWHIQRGAIPITHSKNVEHIRQNMRAREFVLSDEEMKQIDSLDCGKRFFTKVGIDNPNYMYNK